MQPNLSMVLEQVGKDKGIDKKVLLQTLEQAILTAAKKVFGMNRELEAQFNEESGQVDLFQVCIVTEDQGTPGRDSVKKYLAALRSAATPKLALEQTLGADCDEIARRLGVYIGAGAHPVYRFKPPLAGIEASLRSEVVSEDEVARAHRELLRAVGQIGALDPASP